LTTELGGFNDVAGCNFLPGAAFTKHEIMGWDFVIGDSCGRYGLGEATEA
jgi:hypothetical protein